MEAKIARGGSQRVQLTATSGIQKGGMPESPQLPVSEFQDATSALAHLSTYTESLSKKAAEISITQRRDARDQDFAVEVIKMCPPHPKGPPVLIVGGMGPLAGAQAMEAALHKFADDREIVLIQLCNTPDRTAALKKESWERKETSEEQKEVIAALAAGFATAEQYLTTPQLCGGHAHMVVACNTAHNFVPEAYEQYKATRGQHAVLNFDSLIECVGRHLEKAQKPVLILGTDGTRKTRLYTDPLTARGTDCVNLNDADQAVLMDAIYKGVKAFNPAETRLHGESLFLKLVENKHIDPAKGCVILSACTEVPEIIKVLKGSGFSLLAQADIVDPVATTLDHIASADAARTTTGPESGLLNPGTQV